MITQSAHIVVDVDRFCILAPSWTNRAAGLFWQQHNRVTLTDTMRAWRNKQRYSWIQASAMDFFTQYQCQRYPVQQCSQQNKQSIIPVFISTVYMKSLIYKSRPNSSARQTGKQWATQDDKWSPTMKLPEGKTGVVPRRLRKKQRSTSDIFTRYQLILI